MPIMKKMLAVLDAPRSELKPHAPRIITVKIPIDKIGALIGPGGKNIRSLQEETGTKIDVQEDGTVYIASTDGVGAKVAQERVEALGESAVVGNIYTGKVVRIADFGVFVEILPASMAWCTFRSWTPNASTRSRMWSTWATRSPSWSRISILRARSGYRGRPCSKAGPPTRPANGSAPLGGAVRGAGPEAAIADAAATETATAAAETAGARA